MTMRSHPEDDALFDVASGSASAEAARHVAACAPCAERVADARVGLALASRAEVPEPSPLFFDAFRGRVAAALDGAAPPARRRYAGFLLPAFLATAATVAVIAYLPTDVRSPLPSPTASAWSALPAAGDPAVEGVSTVSAEEIVACRDVAECVAGLSEEESRAFADALRAELAGSEDL
jgi:hypothetical protein